MKKLLLVAAMAIFGSSAMADNFDNTTAKLTAKSENYGVSFKAPKTGATELAANTNVGGVEIEGKWFRNGNVNDFAVEVEKKTFVSTTPLYIGGKAEYTFGDSYTSKTQTLIATPYVGVAASVGNFTPFVEAGYAFKSLSDKIVDFSRNDSYIKAGASYALDKKADLKLTVRQGRDVNFKNPGDAQAEFEFIVKF